MLLAALVDGNRPLAAALLPSLPLMLVEKHLAARGRRPTACRRQRALAGSRHRLLPALVAPGGAPQAVQEIVLHALPTPRPGEPPLDGALAIEPETQRTCSDRRRRRRTRAARRRGWGNGSSNARTARRVRARALAACRSETSRALPSAPPAQRAARHGDAAAALGGAALLCSTRTSNSSACCRWVTTLSAASSPPSPPRSIAPRKLPSSPCAPPMVPSTTSSPLPSPCCSPSTAAPTLGPPVGADGALVGTAIDVLAKVSVSEVLMFPRHADLRRRLLRVVPASRSALSTPRRSPLAVRAAADGGGGGARRRRRCDRSSQRLRIDGRVGSLLAAIQVAGDADATLSVEAICAAIASRGRSRGGARASRPLRRRVAPAAGGVECAGGRPRPRWPAAHRSRSASPTPPSLFVAASSVRPPHPTPTPKRRRRRGGARGGGACARASPGGDPSLLESVHERLSALAEALRVEALEEPLLAASSGATAAASRWTRRRRRRWRGRRRSASCALCRRRRRARRAVARPPFPAGTAPPAALRRYELLDPARRPRAAPAAAAAAAPRPAARRPRCPRQTRARRFAIARAWPQRRHPSAALASRPPISVHRDTRCRR